MSGFCHWCGESPCREEPTYEPYWALALICTEPDNRERPVVLAGSDAVFESLAQYIQQLEHCTMCFSSPSPK